MTQPPHPHGDTPRWPGERPISGRGAPSYGPPPQSLGQRPTPEVKRPGCFKTVLIVFGIFVVLFLAIGVLAAIQGDTEDGTAARNDDTVEPTHEANPEPPRDEPKDRDEGHADEEDAQASAEPEAAAEEPEEEVPEGPTFRGMKDSDKVTVPDDWLTKGQIGYNSLPLRHLSRHGTSLLCTTVAVANRSNDEVDFSYFNWELQMPNGVIESPSLLDGGRQTLSGLAELAPEGDVHGDVCFEADPTTLPGEYIVLRDASTFFTTRRMAWVNYF